VACWLLPQLPCVELKHFVTLTFDVFIGIVNSIVSRNTTYLRAQALTVVETILCNQPCHPCNCSKSEEEIK
jgi:hypothetical protein